MKLEFKVGDEVYVINEDLTCPIVKVRITGIYINECSIIYNVTENNYSDNLMFLDGTFRMGGSSNLVFNSVKKAREHLTDYIRGIKTDEEIREWIKK